MPERPDRLKRSIGEMVLLNRFLVEERGDDFIDAFADYVERQALMISEQSMEKLVRAAASVRLSQEELARRSG